MMNNMIWVKIKGKEYHGGFPASFANSLCEMQRGFYRTAALALHGEENIKRLTNAELEKYEIVFRVEEGCTEISTDLADKITTLVEEAFKTMPAEYQATLIGFSVLCYFGWKAFNSWQNRKSSESEQATKENMANAIESVANKGFETAKEIADIVSRNTETLKDSVLKNAATADQIELAGNVYTQADIQEANKRNKSDRTSTILHGQFRIAIIDNTYPELLKLTLLDKLGAEYIAKIDTTDMFAEDVQKIWAAAQSGQFKEMYINAVMKNGVYEKGFIESIEL
ncbi:MAG: hypothetical protein KIC74_00225 [Neisseria sp.]|nr:hypothetical protein [Neisseria sp.]